MNMLEEGLNDQLEQLVQPSERDGPQAKGFTRLAPVPEHAPQIEKLVALAWRLQRAPQVQATSDFARRLERHLLHHYAQRRLQDRKPWSLLLLARAHPLLRVTLGLCVLVCLLSSGVLALAARVSDPGNPLYAISLWERHMQVQFSGGPADQATLDLQLAREQLDALAGLADPAHAGAYRQALHTLDQQIHLAATAIDELAAGAQQDHLTGRLAVLKSDAVGLLHHLLPRLALPERLATTGELGNLGETVPLLARARLLLPPHPNGQATVSLSGSDLQAGAHLLVNGVVEDARGTFQQGQMVFVVAWQGTQHPRSLGILNPDDTAAQTTAITIAGPANGNPTGKGNQPTGTPTPHNNKPPVTPTPHGNQPTGTPTPHH
ncbi:MAG TPA: hypothetical protein VGF67_18630 [Ktedonobacteraceae bacterium]